MDYDVIFIGSGHSCNHGGIALAVSGKKVAFVEMDKMGGTCTNYGCDAKIMLDGPFEFLEGLKRYEGLCVESDVKIHWTKLMAYKKESIGRFDPILEKIFSDMGIDVIRGRGKLVDAHTVDVDGRQISAENIVIGTGQRNAQLDIPGSAYTHGSSHFLDLDVMPEHMVCIGAGIISMEFASMALMLGKKVSFIEFAPRALAAYPSEYVDKMVEKMKGMGATFYFGEAVSDVEKNGNSYLVKTNSGLVVEGDYVLDATGRIANVEDLGLEELGIEASRRGIKVDDHLRTSVPNLVFTLPRIGQVGVTLDEARADEEKYRIVNVPYGVQNDWVDNHETDADITFVYDKEGYLCGAAIYGSEAGSWLDYLSLIIDKKMTAMDLRATIMSFPTQTYMLWSTLLPNLKQY